MWETRTGRKQHNLVFADRNYVCDYMHMSVEVRSDHKLSQETHFDVRCVEYRVDHTWSVPSGWILIPGLNKARYTQQSSLPQKGAVLACWCGQGPDSWTSPWELLLRLSELSLSPPAYEAFEAAEAAEPEKDSDCVIINMVIKI